MVLAMNHVLYVFERSDAPTLFVLHEIRSVINEDGDAPAPAACHDAAATALLLVAVDTPPVRPDDVADARRMVSDAGDPSAADADVPPADVRHLRLPHTLTLPR